VRRADHSSRGVLPTVVRLNESDHGTPKMRRSKPAIELFSHKQTKPFGCDGYHAVTAPPAKSRSVGSGKVERGNRLLMQ
jgi:hypothetical protein